MGTTFSDAIDFCGGFAIQPEKIILGGPMMGTAQSTIEMPLIKGTSSILAFAEGEANTGVESLVSAAEDV